MRKNHILSEVCKDMRWNVKYKRHKGVKSHMSSAISENSKRNVMGTSQKTVPD